MMAQFQSIFQRHGDNSQALSEALALFTNATGIQGNPRSVADQIRETADKIRMDANTQYTNAVVQGATQISGAVMNVSISGIKAAPSTTADQAEKDKKVQAADTGKLAAGVSVVIGTSTQTSKEGLKQLDSELQNLMSKMLDTKSSAEDRKKFAEQYAAKLKEFPAMASKAGMPIEAMKAAGQLYESSLQAANMAWQQGLPKGDKLTDTAMAEFTAKLQIMIKDMKDMMTALVASNQVILSNANNSNDFKSSSNVINQASAASSGPQQVQVGMPPSPTDPSAIAIKLIGSGVVIPTGSLTSQVFSAGQFGYVPNTGKDIVVMDALLRKNPVVLPPAGPVETPFPP